MSMRESLSFILGSLVIDLLKIICIFFLFFLWKTIIYLHSLITVETVIKIVLANRPCAELVNSNWMRVANCKVHGHFWHLRSLSPKHCHFTLRLKCQLPRHFNKASKPFTKRQVTTVSSKFQLASLFSFFLSLNN